MLVGNISSNANVWPKCKCGPKKKRVKNTILAHGISFLAILTIQFSRSQAHFEPFANSTLVYTTRHKEWVTSFFYFIKLIVFVSVLPSQDMKLLEKINEPYINKKNIISQKCHQHLGIQMCQTDPWALDEITN